MGDYLYKQRQRFKDVMKRSEIKIKIDDKEYAIQGQLKGNLSARIFRSIYGDFYDGFNESANKDMKCFLKSLLEDERMPSTQKIKFTLNISHDLGDGLNKLKKVGGTVEVPEGADEEDIKHSIVEHFFSDIEIEYVEVE